MILSRSARAGPSTRSGLWPGLAGFALYRHDRGRRSTKTGSAEFTAADIELRQSVAAMQAQADAELADPKLPTPCRKVLASLQEHWSGLIRFLDDPRIPLDNNASERPPAVPLWAARITTAQGRYGAVGWRRCSFPCSPL